MPVVVTPVDSSLRLQVQTGVDAKGNPVIVNRNFNRIKPEAADQDVLDVAQALGDLQTHTVYAIQRVMESSLAPGA